MNRINRIILQGWTDKKQHVLRQTHNSLQNPRKRDPNNCSEVVKCTLPENTLQTRTGVNIGTADQR